MTMGVTMSVRLNWRLSVQLKQHVTRHMYVHCLQEIRYFDKNRTQELQTDALDLRADDDAAVSV